MSHFFIVTAMFGMALSVGFCGVITILYAKRFINKSLGSYVGFCSAAILSAFVSAAGLLSAFDAALS